MIRRIPMYIVLVLSVLCLFGCEKEPYTLPVSVSVKMVMVPQTNDFLTFDKGLAAVGRISFTGQRLVGGNVSFVTEPGKEQKVVFDTKEGGFVRYFDIPQGEYQMMGWHLYLTDLDLDDDGDETVDLPDDAGLLFVGNYSRLDGRVMPIVFAVESSESFLMTALDPDDMPDITLLAEKKYGASIVFDLGDAFSTLSRSSLEEADVEDGDVPFIEISSDENGELYEMVLYRLQKSAKVVVNQIS